MSADPGHRCPVGACPEDVSSDKLMCPQHWRRVPRPVQRALYAAWDHGRGAGTPEHRAAMRRAVEAAERAQ